jgi:F-type H+-transporting ATPase subunit a
VSGLLGGFTLLAAEGGEAGWNLAEKAVGHIARHPLFGLGRAFNNHMLMLLVSAGLLLLVVPVVARGRGVVPRGAYNFFEAILQFLREEVARPALGHATDKFIPFIWTFFFLILTANLLGMIPIGPMAGVIDEHVLGHIGGTATGNLSITLGLGLCAFFLIHIGGMREKGVGHYWHEFFFGHSPIWLAPLMIPLEILGAVVKAFALSIRLFANMIAGHIVVATLVIFAAIGLQASGAMLGVTAAGLLGAIAISLLETFVCFLQAYIFTFLTTLFIGMAVQSEH